MTVSLPRGAGSRPPGTRPTDRAAAVLAEAAAARATVVLSGRV